MRLSVTMFLAVLLLSVCPLHVSAAEKQGAKQETVVPQIVEATQTRVAKTDSDISFQGQFRMVTFFESDSVSEAKLMESHLRWRPSWDVKAQNNVRMHLQLQVGDIDSNVNHTRNSPDDAYANPVVGVRQAYLTFGSPDDLGIGGHLSAGLIPVSDRFGDTLFSGDYGFSPLGIMWFSKIDNWDIRLGTGKLSEADKDKDGKDNDDTDIYYLDLDNKSKENKSYGVSIYRYSDLNKNGVDTTENYIGVRGSKITGKRSINGFLIYNTGVIHPKAGGDDSTHNGFALKAEWLKAVGDSRFGIMGTYASGSKNGKQSFISPSGLKGYWGYTGIITMQPATETITPWFINMNGNGSSGLISLQAKYETPMLDRTSIYLAGGTFQHIEAPAGAEKNVGFDVFASGKYKISSNLDCDAGLAYASLGKGTPAYSLAKEDGVVLLFAKLQYEY